MKMRFYILSMWRSIGGLLIALLFITSYVHAQERSVSGTVTDESGETLPGVNVSVKGTSTGTVTDADGQYEITVPGSDAVLVFSFVGYATEEVQVENRSTLDVNLTPDVEELQEVVVVGYGSQRKSDLTGSVATVKSEDINKVSSIDITQGMQGRMPGVQVTSNSGNPAEGTRVRIRGMGTINNSDPLYVVDGFQTGDISWLAPTDIKSVEVLKDASATAIYGSRGANGVIMITTKDGSDVESGTRVQLNAFGGLQEPGKKLDLMNAHEYLDYRVESHLNQLIADNPDGVENPGEHYTRDQALERFAGDDAPIARQVLDNNLEGTDWQDEVLRQSSIQTYNLNISGNKEGFNYVLSGNYQDNEGVMENSYLEKLNLRFKSDIELADWARAGININYLNDENSQYDGTDRFTGVLPAAVRADPIAPVWNNNTGNWGSPDFSDVRNNPVQRVQEVGMSVRRRNKYVGNAFLEFDITDALSFRTRGSYDYDETQIKDYQPEYFVNNNATRPNSILTEEFATRINWLSSNYINYNEEWTNHSIDGMLGFEVQSGQNNIQQMRASNVPETEKLRYLNQSKDAESYQAFNEVTSTALMSYFGRVNYGFLDKYKLTATLRYDGTSRFVEDNRWGLFPSFAAAWNASQESFLQNVDALSTLKLRASWGQVGNESSAGAHPTTTFADPRQNYSFGGQIVNGKAPRSLSNRGIIWETSETINAGIDGGLFKDKITFNADYFIRNTKDMIVGAPRPLYAGANSPDDNIGSLRNSGVELAINYRNRENAVKVDIGYNVTFLENEVTGLGEGEDFIEGDNFAHIGILTRTQVGRPVSSFYGLKTDGLFQSDEEAANYTNDDGDMIQPNAKAGDVKFIDENGDGEITDEDRDFIGDPFPDFNMGLSGTVEYMGFDFSFLLNGSYGNEVVNNLNYYMATTEDWRDNQYAYRMDYFSEDNTDTNEPRVIASDPNNNSRYSDRYVEDASFIRLRNVQLGYTLPESVVSPLGISKLRFYIAADNLFVLTDYTGYDPEIGEFYGNPLNYGVAGANYPKPRTYFAGINLNF